MGTRRSRHNKGRKGEKHHDIVGLVCETCSEVFFNKEGNTKKGRGRVCPSCLAGIAPRVREPRSSDLFPLRREHKIVTESCRQPVLAEAARSQCHEEETGASVRTGVYNGNRLHSYHLDAIELLRKHPIVCMPRAICHGAALRYLERLDIVTKTGIPGYWAITDYGRQIDLTPTPAPAIDGDSVTANPASVVTFAAEPNDENSKKLLEAYAAINSLMAGSLLFGGIVRQASLDVLAGKTRPQRFVYFAYPLGFPLKHIAWTARQDKPNWTDHNVCVVRGQVLGLPSLRMRIKRDVMVRESERTLRTKLRNEGLSDWEITEYFAVTEKGVAL